MAAADNIPCIRMLANRDLQIQLRLQSWHSRCSTGFCPTTVLFANDYGLAGAYIVAVFIYVKSKSSSYSIEEYMALWNDRQGRKVVVMLHGVEAGVCAIKIRSEEQGKGKAGGEFMQMRVIFNL
jgi:hypothetical protein